MRVKQFIYAEEVIQSNVGDVARTTITNPLNFISVPFFPSTYSFGFNCGVAETDDVTGNLFLRFSCEEKNEENVNDVVNIGPINLGMIPKDESLPKHLRGFMFSANLRNVILRKAGIYKFEVLIDDTVIDTFPIEAVVRVK